MTVRTGKRALDTSRLEKLGERFGFSWYLLPDTADFFLSVHPNGKAHILDIWELLGELEGCFFEKS